MIPVALCDAARKVLCELVGFGRDLSRYNVGVPYRMRSHIYDRVQAVRPVNVYFTYGMNERIGGGTIDAAALAEHASYYLLLTDASRTLHEAYSSGYCSLSSCLQQRLVVPLLRGGFKDIYPSVRAKVADAAGRGASVTARLMGKDAYDE